MSQAFRIREQEDGYHVTREDVETPPEGQVIEPKQEDGSYLISKQEDALQLPTNVALSVYNATVTTQVARLDKRARMEGVWEALQALSGPNSTGGTGHVATKIAVKAGGKSQKKSGATRKGKTAASPKEPKAFKPIEPARKKDDIKQAREGTKVALLIDLLSSEKGTTIQEIEAKLSKAGRPIKARSWLGHSLRSVHGYGVKAKMVDGQERLFLDYPEGMRKPLPHKSKEENGKSEE
jgi:hypothetical protein